MASFANESTKMGFKMTIDNESKTVSISKVSATATANMLDAIGTKLNALFEVTPTSHTRTSVDLIEG